MDLYINGSKKGTLVKSDYSQNAHGGVDGLNQKQFDAYKYAKSLISAGKGNYQKARQVLEAAGFELLPSARGPDDRKFDAEFLA